MTENTFTLPRRFDRMARLVSEPGLQALFKSHVMIIGLGGVGSWAAESLARSGIGQITLVDFDLICVTNINRQLHALQNTIGKSKVEVMAERLVKINPQLKVNLITHFYNETNSELILCLNPDYILDCIDNLTAKSYLIYQCQQKNIKLISALGTGGRLDPLKSQIADLADTHTDPMAHQLRKILRQRYQFSANGPWGITSVFSTEVPQQPHVLSYDHNQEFQCVCPQKDNQFHSCEKRNVILGTASFMTGFFGLLMSNWVVQEVTAASKIPTKSSPLSENFNNEVIL